MAKDAVISVILRLRDEMGGQARKALDALAQSSKGAAQGAGASAKALTQMGRSANEASGQLQAAGRAAGAFRSDRIMRAAQDAARLTRESREARKEIDAAAKSGQRLADSFSKVAGAGRTAMGVMHGIGQAGAGVAAGGVVAGRALAKPISYESRLNKMARVAFADKDAAGQIAGMNDLNGVITKATGTGGGTRENAAEALNSLLAGNMEYGQASRALPKILKASMGGDISAEDLSKVVLSGTKQGWFSENEIEEVLDVLVKGGQEGSFEGKDMAKWMPELMAQAQGMKGKEGFKRLVATLQGQAVVAGSNDKAANNLANLLGKLFAQDTQKDFVKIGIDLQGTLAKAAGKGMDPLTAIVKTMEEKVFAKDKRFQALKKKFAEAKDDKQKTELLENMADIVKRSALGTVFQDREAQLGLAASMSQKDYISKVFSNLENSRGTVDTAYQVASQSTEFKSQQLQNEKDNAMFRTLQNIGPALNSVLDAATGLSREFPGLATVVAEASTAVGVFSAGLLAAGGFRMIAGKGGTGAVAAASGWLGRGAGALTRAGGRAMPWLLAGEAAYDIYRNETNPTLSRTQKNINNAETYGATGGALAGMWGGAATGAALGSVIPILGTVLGGAIGAGLGALGGLWAGGEAGRGAGHMLYGPSPETLKAAEKLATKDERTINVNAQLYVDGREMARVVNQYNADDANRY